MNKFAFFDRDGVINVDLGYVNTRDKFLFVDGIIELMKIIIDLGYEIIIITNQSGIGRGFYTDNQYQKLTSWYLKKLKLENIDIKEVFYCPHFLGSKNNELAVDCSCRKPNPGMLIKAEKKYTIDMSKSFIIGDKITDVIAGFRAGLPRAFLINSHYETENAILSKIISTGCEVHRVNTTEEIAEILTNK